MTTPLDLQAERFTATGNITSEGLRNQLGRPRLDRLAVLVRESAQNAWDAQAPDSPCVKFGVACYEFSPAQVEVLSNRVMHDLPAVASASGESILKSLLDRASEKIARGEGSGLRGLAIYDRGTTGLGGPTRADAFDDGDEARDFIDFLRNIGQPPDKERGGGTFGYGKAALYLSSAVSTILVHTRCLRLGELEPRFMGSCLSPHYETQAGRFTGRHWWGRWDDARRVVDPLLGDEADEIAAALGMPPCRQDELGTTILIVAPEFDERTPTQAMNYIAMQMLWNFWPKMIRKEGALTPSMEFEAWLDGRAVAIPPAKSTPPIDGFVRALQSVRSAEAGSADDVAVRATVLNCHSPKRRLGLLGLCNTIRRPRNEVDCGEDPVLPPFYHRSHHVALLRRAELVVTYHPGPALPNDHWEYAGVFLADDSLDRTYAAAEPPTHDEWRPENLADARSRRLVGSTFRRIDEATAKFVKPATTGFETAPDRPLTAVAEHLGTLLIGTEGPGGANSWGGPVVDERARRGKDHRNANPGDRLRAVPKRNRLTSKLRVELSREVQLLEYEGEVVRVFHFKLIVPAEISGVRIDACAYAVLGGGVRESDPPEGVDRPIIKEWRAPTGTIVGSGNVVEVTTAQDGEYSLSVVGAREAIVGLELKVEARSQ